jgi:hypothetical protein
MNWILKNKNKNSKALLVVLFLVFISLLFSSNNVKAAAGVCEGASDGGTVTEKTCECFDGSTSLKLFPAGQDISDSGKTSGTGFCTQEVCMIYCKAKYPSTTSVKFDGGTLGTKSSVANSSSAVATAPTIADALGGVFTQAIMYILTQIHALVGWLFAIAATLFAWAIEPANMSGPNGLLNKQAVKDVWIMVRDLLNMTFILVLLFAAFCTIFQVDSWNLKKVWLNILINALLVNFSYPIARFFIDVSNVAFYYFVNHLFSSTGTVTGSGIFAMFGTSSSIGTLLSPDAFTGNAIAYQVAMIVVTFIMGMTLLIVAALFIVRLVALTMIVMFSPIGFVGYIFPDTRKYANNWWTSLFSYSFFAPIMIFIMAVALRVAEALKAENFQSLMSNASANTPANQTTWIANAAFFVIPIIILWMGMGIAKSMGIAGADTVVSSVKKGGKWLANRPGAVGGYAWKQSGIPGGVKKGFENARKSGKLFGSEKLSWALKDGREDREGKLAGFMDNRTKGVADAVEKKKAEEFRKKAKEKADEHDDKSGIDLAKEIYAAKLTDPKDGEKNAMKVAAMLHHLKSDSSKKDEYDAHLMSSILSDPIHAGNMSSMTDSAQKDAYVKTAMSEHWKALNKKAKQAHDVAVKKKAPTDEVTEAPKPKAMAGTFTGGAGI